MFTTIPPSDRMNWNYKVPFRTVITRVSFCPAVGIYLRSLKHPLVSLSHSTLPSDAGDKYANDANTIELAGYGVFDLNLGYTLSVGKNDETVRLGIQSFNIFNSEGITEGSPRLGDNQTDEEFFVGRPIIPRTFLVSATFRF